MEPVISSKYIFSALTFSLEGMLILWLAFILFDKLTPGDLWKEIIIEKNVPLAIITGAVTLAVGQIIASAIHG